MQTIDGSVGEGGGQVLRSALALAMSRLKAIRIINIRAGRDRPGLRPQHLAAVKAAARISRADVDGAILGSKALTFAPNRVLPGDYDFPIGTAGSATLVLQTVLPALMLADGESRLSIEGGTHNPQAPTFDFVARAFLPLIERMGPKIRIEMPRPGFYPRGGGLLDVRISPVGRLLALNLEARGKLRSLTAEILLSKLPQHIADREARVLSEGLDIGTGSITVRRVMLSLSPGNAVTVFCECEQITEAFAAIGRRGVPAERIARDVVRATRQYLAEDVPVGPHLADQLLLPLALAGAGSFVSLRPTPHTLTNKRVIEQLMPVKIDCEPISGTGKWRIAVNRTETRTD